MSNLKPKSVSFCQEATIFTIKIYQHLRPYLDRVVMSVFGVSSECKHTPSCSNYTLQSIRRHGTIAGVAKGFSRILSCR